MSMSLKNACFDLWRTNFERKGIRDRFVPVFTRYIGVENTNEYDDVLKTLITKAEEDKEHSIYFDNQIPMTAEFGLINSVKAELATMDVRQISKQDIVLFEDLELNKFFLESLEYVVNLALSQETFMNDSVRNYFICKLILYAYLHIHKLKFENNKTNKCIYYGNIAKHDIYFLILLYRMTFDVIYINPLKEEYWEQIDRDKLSSLHKNKQILPVNSLAERLREGRVIEANQSMTLQFEQQIENELFTNSGVYKPWQFRNGNTQAIFFNSTIIDVEMNIYEPAKVRQGFKVNGKTVSVPHFFFEVEGEYKNMDDYAKIVNKCINAPNTLVLTDNGESMITNRQSAEAKYQLMFCQLSDGSFNTEEIKRLPFYAFAPYNDATEDFLLNKINETIRDKSLFKDPIDTKEEIIDFGMLILSLDKKIIRLIDNFDFTNDIPKLVMFLDNETELTKDACYVLAFLNTIGFDIIIFTPAGLSSLNTHIEESRFNSIRLDTTNYNRTLASVKAHKPKKSGFFGKFFAF